MTISRFLYENRAIATMSRRSREIFQTFLSRINKSSVFNSATNAIENVSNKAHLQLNNMQHVATLKYNTIVKQMNDTIIIQDVNEAKLRPSDPIPKKLLNWWRWYQELTGLRDVELAKNHVLEVQQKLFVCQDKRRFLTNESSLINERLKEIYGEIIQTKRDDPKYVQLTILENKGLQEQTKIGSQLNLLENTERDYFTQLATAIKEYHDSQTINAQKYKYFSILASAGLAIVSLCASMVYNNRRIKDVRRVIADAQQKNNETFIECFTSLEQRLKTTNKILEKNMNNIDNNIQRYKPVNTINHSKLNDSPEMSDSKKLAIGAGVILLFFWLRS